MALIGTVDNFNTIDTRPINSIETFNSTSYNTINSM